MSRLVSRKQAGRRVGEEWYECQRCGFNYPRHQVLVQNGLIVCRGPDTTNCFDLPGHAAELARIDVPAEKPIEPLPEVTEDL